MYIELFGTEYAVIMKEHAVKRIRQRNILPDLILNDLKNAEESLGELKNGDNFIIIDSFGRITIVGKIYYQIIEITTVVDTGEDFFVKYASDKVILIK
ncbi:hypothetical protein VTU32_08275 [Thermoanaerobacter sp. CM-CNRG TB177]|jgi:uncharacterized Rossmann fold enzyme|uniref:hypothetical protein n=1 Tax=Thermoanaerobacter sp. CM-CNRG TB177 TaxID=2800659 RepID=UPI001BDE27E7|nr:hypothetical protein [Thermoanaerobacter sp. CM-CNRG TB177]MBT1280268.1 hypothetical protein [Thermoanaerobacter sp. CM-CNRG TB177]